MNTEQLILSHLGVLVAGIAAAYAYLRHLLGYLSPFEAQVKADIAHLLASLQSPHAPSVTATPAAPGPSPIAGSGAAPITAPSQK